MTWSGASLYELARLSVAIEVSPDVAICEALLWGESVPAERLTASAHRFAKSKGLGERVSLDDLCLIPTTRRVA